MYSECGYIYIYIYSIYIYVCVCMYWYVHTCVYIYIYIHVQKANLFAGYIPPLSGKHMLCLLRHRHF